MSVEPSPSPRLSRLETAGLFASLAVLLTLGTILGFAILPKAAAPVETDGPGNPGATYRADQPVFAWHDGRWYPAHVHSADGGRYFITYDEFSISWHEWVTARRLRQRK